MKRINFLIVAFVTTLVLFSACKKDNDTSPGVVQGFYYGENDTATLTKADSAYANNSFHTIIARKNNSTVVEINSNDLQVGTYAIISSEFSFTYVKNGTLWNATSGTLKITKNDGSKLSGTFSASAAGTIYVVTGKFDDIPIQ